MNQRVASKNIHWFLLRSKSPCRGLWMSGPSWFSMALQILELCICSALQWSGLVSTYLYPALEEVYGSEGGVSEPTRQGSPQATEDVVLD